jgi:hypothetical protein
MERSQTTASAIINFSEKLEEESSNFYEKLAEKFAKGERVFLSFAEESKKNKVLLIRTYRETITDALEACYSFEGLNLTDYAVKFILTEGISYFNALKRAIELEDKVIKFYLEVAKLSKPLLATIPSAFRKVAENRSIRKQLLKSLLDEATANA